MNAHLKKHSFSLWLLLAIGLAAIFPFVTAKGGWLPGKLLSDVGVFVIFLLQGFSLPTSELSAGIQPKRLHAFTLGWNYLVFPALTFLFLLPASFFLKEEYRLGFGLLAILPTTVSSAITFAAISGGSTPNAIFSTVFSNLLAVLLVPTLGAAYLATESDVSIPLLPLFSKLATLIILPLIIGQIVRAVRPATAAFISKRTKKWGNWIIIFIVHVAFANSVKSGFLDDLSLGDTLLIISCTVFLLLVVGGCVWFSSGWMRLSSAQRVTAYFCASQKSIATGLPLLTSLFAASAGGVNSAIALIPLMCYHPAQLILAGFLSSRFQSQNQPSQ